MKNATRSKKPSKKVEKKSTLKKSPLRRKPVRTPGIDKGKVIIMPDFDAPLPEFD
jgi:hypothetical protein